jgi:hypothetical protein
MRELPTVIFINTNNIYKLSNEGRKKPKKVLQLICSHSLNFCECLFFILWAPSSSSDFYIYFLLENLWYENLNLHYYPNALCYQDHYLHIKRGHLTSLWHLETLPKLIDSFAWESKHRPRLPAVRSKRKCPKNTGESRFSQC